MKKNNFNGELKLFFFLLAIISYFAHMSNLTRVQVI